MGAMLFSLPGCGEPVPHPSQQSASAQSSPAVTVEQVKRVEDRVLTAVEKADRSRDPSLLDGSLSGPELAIRSSQLTVEKAVNKDDPKKTIPRTIRQRVLPVTSGWPRTVYTITSTTVDQQSERLLVFQQESATSNYTLWGLVRLFSGIRLPKFEIPSIGSRQGTDKDTGLVMTPRQADRLYASVLTNRNAPNGAKVENDQFRRSLGQLEGSVEQGVKANEGTQEQTFTPDLDHLAVMRSADGGDLVVARIDSTWTRSAGGGRQSNPASDAEKALFGDQKATSRIQVQYVNTVALYVPPAARNATIRAVGAERESISAKPLS